MCWKDWRMSWGQGSWEEALVDQGSQEKANQVPGFLFFLFFLLYLLIFNWLMIALQYWFDFCRTSAWISHRDTYGPSFLNLPPTSHPFPPLEVVTFWVSWVLEQISISYLFYIGIYFHATLSIHLTLLTGPLVFWACVLSLANTIL